MMAVTTRLRADARIDRFSWLRSRKRPRRKQAMIPRYFKWLAPVAVGCISLLTYQGWSRQSPVSEPAGLNNYVVSRASIEDTVSAMGRLQPIRGVDVGTQVSGQLEALFVDIGDEVKNGQPLAKIEENLYRARVEATVASVTILDAQLEERRRKFEQEANNNKRAERLAQNRFVSEKELEAQDMALKTASSTIKVIEAEKERASAMLRVDQINLKYTNIVAPIDGTITSISAYEGQTLSAVQDAPTIVGIADLHRMTVEAFVSEADISRIEIGLAAYFTILGEKSRQWLGLVRQINPRPEVVNNVVLYKVMFDVDNPDGVLKMGMTAQVHFVRAKAEKALIVPIAFVQFDNENATQDAPENKAFVYVLENNEAARREVKTGVRNRTSIEVQSGLNEGDTVTLDVNKT
ncbi:efflux RND transporter periplasmic adaptor subunit [Ochrobactrum quorumnocens]|uniref:Efflux RND transporter periplasmic adaptor subunit n=1 Tax=Ochrobactrum quorumnocens TaxID=271865 RepID=A0A5N1JAT4_9HYPH|nr:efflux RND transporter periplasmic adaptor subunit [[Ochrobactrum] quorumnocens]